MENWPHNTFQDSSGAPADQPEVGWAGLPLERLDRPPASQTKLQGTSIQCGRRRACRHHLLLPRVGARVPRSRKAVLWKERVDVFGVGKDPKVGAEEESQEVRHPWGHRKEAASEMRSQEKAYKSDFFMFCKKAWEGTLSKEKVQPSFSKVEADRD